MEITLEQLLVSRERRQGRQRELLERYPRSLISFLVNMPGPVKYCDLSAKLHQRGMAAISGALSDGGHTVFFSEVRALPTGIEGFFSVGADAVPLKRAMLQIEEQHPLGRLFDIDVLGPDGVPLSRQQLGCGPRKCLLCDRDGADCARSARHTKEALIAAMEEMLDRYGV